MHPLDSERVTARVLAVLIALAAADARGASIQALSTTRAGSQYSATLRAHLDVPALAAYAVIANVNDWQSINAGLSQFELLARHEDGSVDVSTGFQACVLWYCRLIHEVSGVSFARTADGGDVYILLHPNSGDFHSGRAHWRVRSVSGGTQVEFTVEVDPTITVPPLIGPWLIERWMRTQAVETCAKVEALARLQDPEH
jgi:hypothetical protein